MAGMSRSGGESLCETVVDTVARREGVAPARLDAPLYDVLDPDALEELLSSMEDGDGLGHVAFDYLGYEVTVYSDGRVTVDDPAERPAAEFVAE